jgi:hypothetical protein
MEEPEEPEEPEETTSNSRKPRNDRGIEAPMQLTKKKSVPRSDKRLRAHRLSWLLVFVVGIFAVLLSQFASLLKAVGKAFGHLLRPSASRISAPIYAPDPFTITGRVVAVDRSGRPLPWRWERSLSRDLLGQYGWVAASAAVVIAALAQTVPNTPNRLPAPPQARVPTTQTLPTASETAGRKVPENTPGSPKLPDRPNIDNPFTGSLINMK